MFNIKKIDFNQKNSILVTFSKQLNTTNVLSQIFFYTMNIFFFYIFFKLTNFTYYMLLFFFIHPMSLPSKTFCLIQSCLLQDLRFISILKFLQNQLNNSAIKSKQTDKLTFSFNILVQLKYCCDIVPSTTPNWQRRISMLTYSRHQIFTG